MDIRIAERINETEPERWNHLAGSDYPFIRHEFLNALETTGCVSHETGWLPRHILVLDGDTLIAAMPCYIKRHSRGEYVFDYQWAQAYLHYGQAYYPKALNAIPFTPCVGPRIIHAGHIDLAQLMPWLTDAIKLVIKDFDLSSWHGLFADNTQLELLAEQGFIIRQGVQFHWYNRNYRDFDDFLSRFNSRKRKQAKRERQRINEQCIDLEMVSGVSLTEYHWAWFYRLYADTYLKKGMAPYLNEAFFQQIGRDMAESIVMALAYHQKQEVAAALFFRGTDTLYGRYWGCAQEFHSLHFETCYYQGIDYCISQRLKHFDAGAQGEHKLARGFEPVMTGSAHFIPDAMFALMIADHVHRESCWLSAYMTDARLLLPYKTSSHE